MIQGMTVTLYEPTPAGMDPFGEMQYTTEEPVEVAGVLVALPSAEERTDAYTRTGAMISYVLGIPKGDTHNWQGAIVEIAGHKYKAVGIPEEGIEANVPGPWHRKVQVERYA